MTLRFTFMERLVGVFILLTLLAFLGSVVLVGQGQHWFREHATFFAVYKEGYNLQPGVKVKILRTDIGHVTNVELTEDNEAKVTMKILAEYATRITTESRAAIESPTIIGSEFINIIPGTGGKPIEPGGRIPSKEAKELTAYLDDLDFDYKMKKLDEILENVAEITSMLQKPQRPLIGSLDNIKKLAQDLNEGQGTLGRIVKKDEIYNQIMKELDQIEGILSSLGSAAKSINKGSKSVSTGAKSVQVVTADLEDRIPDILTKVQNILKDLEKAMGDVPDISKRARRGMRDVNDILESVKKNILIRGNLPPQSSPESHGYQFRGN